MPETREGGAARQTGRRFRPGSQSRGKGAARTPAPIRGPRLVHDSVPTLVRRCPDHGVTRSSGVSDPDDPCDTNVDQVFDENDIAPFFGILAGTYPRMSLVAGDLNGDGEVDELDVPLFLEKLGESDGQ